MNVGRVINLTTNSTFSSSITKWQMKKYILI